ncbi:MAG: DUF4294 domain-containing protein [Bacteroidetes bacterium]|nr:MAG: DUF4294 domain-containing protein [Bacteroidota bacterium]
MKRGLLYILILAACAPVFAQPGSPSDPAELPAPQGAWARLEVLNGDSTFVMALRLVKVAARRKFSNFAEQRQYYLYMRAARKVYPYALQAIDLYDEIAQETQQLNKRQRKRYIRKEHKELKEDFKEQMKKLSRTEGRVLIKMVEKELGEPFFDIIRDTRGSFTANYWHNLGKFWDYDLKEGYVEGADPLLDEVFLDYDFGHPEWWAN